jgi:hypothetical protein
LCQLSGQVAVSGQGCRGGSRSEFLLSSIVVVLILYISESSAIDAGGLQALGNCHSLLDQVAATSLTSHTVSHAAQR